jgi:two-component system response regulator MprA
MTRPPTDFSLEPPPLVFVVYAHEAPDASLSAELIRRGYSVLERGVSAALHQLLNELHPALVILCLDPERSDDADALRYVRSRVEKSSLLVLLPVNQDQSMQRALELGADFCLSAGLPGPLIAAQADALVRHRQRQEGKPISSTVSFRDLVIDFDRRSVRRGGKAIPLTRTEFDVLGVLARNMGRVVSAGEIAAELGQIVTTEAQARVLVKVHISHLRQKLDTPGRPPYLQTIRGVGYLLERREPVSDSDEEWTTAGVG